MAVELLDVIVRVGLVLATTFLFGIVFLTYLRLKNRKLLFLSAGFGVFFIHAIVTIPELFYNFVISENIHLLIHLLALSIILFGTLKD
ncbi:MAG TPA: hypothetical protein VJ044_04795 [Candidatus Hodarchaeales archaeon]|nr:hypothetical protein [Candidatus Hodarchaeales archaeon]